MVAVFGKSGCGKTTLLNVIGGLDGYDSGEVLVNGKKMSQKELAKRAQISRPHLSNIENDEAQPTIDVAIRIAEALGQKVDNIFFKEDVV